MGNVNMVYRNLKADKIRKRISHYFGLQPIVLESWITSLTLLRNACCHHSRVWNKVSCIMPVSPRRIANPWTILPTNPQRVYFTICIIKYFPWHHITQQRYVGKDAHAIFQLSRDRSGSSWISKWMGERTVMGTTSVSALTQRIQELEKENARLSYKRTIFSLLSSTLFSANQWALFSHYT